MKCNFFQCNILLHLSLFSSSTRHGRIRVLSQPFLLFQSRQIQNGSTKGCFKARANPIAAVQYMSVSLSLSADIWPFASLSSTSATTSKPGSTSSRSCSSPRCTTRRGSSSSARAPTSHSYAVKMKESGSPRRITRTSLKTGRGPRLRLRRVPKGSGMRHTATTSKSPRLGEILCISW